MKKVIQNTPSNSFGPGSSPRSRFWSSPKWPRKLDVRESFSYISGADGPGAYPPDEIMSVPPNVLSVLPGGGAVGKEIISNSLIQKVDITVS